MTDGTQAGLTQPNLEKVNAPLYREIGANRIAFHRRAARRDNTASGPQPGLVWFGGFRSDMTATKATALDGFAREMGRAALRFDYSGHGASGGRFVDGTISLWLAESLAMIRAETNGPQVLIGSSMGAWLALLVARALHGAGEGARVAGLVLIAPAVDFTDALLWAGLDAEARRAIVEEGVWLRPSAYAPEPVPITRALVEDGRRHLMLDKPIRTHAPVHIVQGMRDDDVPWRHALRLVEHLAGDPVVVTLIKDGDHRLSRDTDIARIIAAVKGVA